MIDYFIIIYLMKRFGYDKKFDPIKYDRFKVIFFITMFSISVIRGIYFRIDIAELYWGPLKAAGYFGMVGYGVVSFAFYTALLALPFLMIIMTIFGYLGLFFFPLSHVGMGSMQEDAFN